MRVRTYSKKTFYGYNLRCTTHSELVHKSKVFHKILSSYFIMQKIYILPIIMYEFYRDYSRRYIKLINTASELSHI